MDEKEFLRLGILPLLCLVIYALIDKVVAPLVTRHWNNGHGSNRSVRSEESNGNGRSQSTSSYRISRLEEDIHEIRDAITSNREQINSSIHDIQVSAKVSQAILSRLEKRLDDLL